MISLRSVASMAAAVALLTGQANAQELAVGDKVCVEGFVMDLFCIDRGTLLDAPSVVTLEEPNLHSVHCLIDVPSCIATPFEILVPNPADGPAYARGWRLDEETKDRVVNIAKEVGICTECTGEGDKRHGLKVHMEATVTALATSDAPTTVSAMEITPIGNGESMCSQPQELAVGDELCVEGFVMDQFCIDRGTLLDAPTVVTLENPELHSVHCLVDVPSCVASPYEILVRNPEGSPAYARGWVLDDDTKARFIDIAQGGLGICDTCETGGTQERGLRAAFNATVTALATGDTPTTISAMTITPLGPDEMFCPDKAGGGFVPPLLTDSSSNLVRLFLIHGSLMLIGWGWLLPSGVVIAALFKHRPDGLWFKIHRACQVLGLILSIVGWAIALHNFTSLKDKGLNNYRHGVMGIVTMCLGLIQPLNAFIRPHPPKEGEEKSQNRLYWELFHKGTGYLAILLAIATIGLGTTLLPVQYQRTFQIVYGVGAGGLLLALAICCMVDKNSYQPPPEAAKTLEDAAEAAKREQSMEQATYKAPPAAETPDASNEESAHMTCDA